VSFEGALGKAVPAPSGRTRIVVFVATTGQLKTGFFGVLTQGFPQLVRLNEDVVQPHTTEGWPPDAPVLCRVKMINEFPLIPNLEQLEAMLARELTQA
jgi:chemosensory pili system protein ChpC